MYPKDSIMTDEVGNEEKNEHTTSRDSSKPYNTVTAEKHTESPTSEPKWIWEGMHPFARHQHIYLHFDLLKVIY